MEMNKLIEFITKLSNNDKKNLSQKLGKVIEESGELSKSILTYENASGFKDNITTKESILEECCDVILSAISIPLSEGYNMVDIINMIDKKSLYWEEKQIKEDKAEYPLWFEIHVTIDRPSNIEKYTEDCKKIGVKPIVLDLQNGGGTVMKDVMTSSKILGENLTAINETERIANTLDMMGYNVLRKKIESVPWHPKAPRSFEKNPIMPKDCYFESHIGITIVSNNKKGDLDTLAYQNDWHLSKNYFKKNDDGTYVIMLTYRKYDGTYENFLDEIEDIKNELDESGFKYEKVVVEFSLYDSKISHDYKWLVSE